MSAVTPTNHVVLLGYNLSSLVTAQHLLGKNRSVQIVYSPNEIRRPFTHKITTDTYNWLKTNQVWNQLINIGAVPSENLTDNLYIADEDLCTAFEQQIRATYNDTCTFARRTITYDTQTAYPQTRITKGQIVPENKSRYQSICNETTYLKYGPEQQAFLPKTLVITNPQYLPKLPQYEQSENNEFYVRYAKNDKHSCIYGLLLGCYYLFCSCIEQLYYDLGTLKPSKQITSRGSHYCIYLPDWAIAKLNSLQGQYIKYATTNPNKAEALTKKMDEFVHYWIQVILAYNNYGWIPRVACKLQQGIYQQHKYEPQVNDSPINPLEEPLPNNINRFHNKQVCFHIGAALYGKDHNPNTTLGRIKAIAEEVVTTLRRRDGHQIHRFRLEQIVSENPPVYKGNPWLHSEPLPDTKQKS